MSKEKKVSELSSMLTNLRAEKHGAGDNITVKQEREITEKIKSVMSEIVLTITDGANPCSCKSPPHGMVQYTSLKGKSIPYFEIGCLACPDKRAQAFSVDSTVDAWNSESFLPPKKKPE